MTSPSARARTLHGRVGASLLAVALLGLVAPATALADDTPSPTPTVTASPDPSPDPRTTTGATATSLAGLNAPVYDIATTTRSIITTVDSIDGSETQEDTETRRTLILNSKVLFPEDKATLSTAARGRLRSVARQIVASAATGTVEVDGYTDDQGSDQHNLVLSEHRAEAVRSVLAPVLAGTGVSIATRGLGEAHPRYPNLDKSGSPNPANRAKNRRVEISFTKGR